MATGTNLEQDVLTARMRAADARRAGDHATAIAWDDEAETLTTRIIALETTAKWDILKAGRHG